MQRHLTMKDWKIAPQFLLLAEVKMHSCYLEFRIGKKSTHRWRTEKAQQNSWCWWPDVHTVSFGGSTCAQILSVGLFCFNFICNEFRVCHFETKVQLFRYSCEIHCKTKTLMKPWLPRDTGDMKWCQLSGFLLCSCGGFPGSRTLQISWNIACCWEGGSLKPSAIHCGNFCIIVIKEGGLLGSYP